jgi:ornithine carbamoyltransferase
MALNLARWVNLIVARTYSHEVVQELAAYSSAPVINGLSEYSHPCQGLTDYFTLTEKVGEDLKGFHLAYVGDGNNTCHSLVFGAAKLGAHITVGVPKGYEPDADVLKRARKDARATGAKIEVVHDPFEAVDGADAVYTDVWASMGYEAETEKRREIFSSFRVTKKLMGAARKGAFFMHCLPAHRGDEVDADVIDNTSGKGGKGGASIVYDQAENRLHTQKAIMLLLARANG